MKLTKNIFGGSTRFSGPSVMGFDDEIMIEQLQVGVPFFLFQIVTNNFKALVTLIGSSDQEELNFAGSGFRSSFYCKYSGKQSLISQSVSEEECKIVIYCKGDLLLENCLLTFG